MISVIIGGRTIFRPMTENPVTNHVAQIDNIQINRDFPIHTDLRLMGVDKTASILSGARRLFHSRPVETAP